MASRLVVFGIDGGTWDVVSPMIAQGELPNLSTLIDEGVHGSLRSTLPPQSAPAWVSLATGQNPGRHGVFGFWTRDFRQYEDLSSRLSQSTAFAGRTLWDYAGAAGLRVGVVSVPITYPAWPVNGFLISGSLLAPEMGQAAAYPPELSGRYGRSLNFPDSYRYGASRETVMRTGPQMMVRRKEAVLELLAQYPTDLLVVVMGETDKAQHDFWRYREADCPRTERELYGDVISEHYRVADRAVGEILDAFGPDASVAVVSDHGAGGYPRRALRTNAWLRELGLLSVRRRGGIPQDGLRALARRAKRLLPGRLQSVLRQRRGGQVLRALHSQYAGTHGIIWSATQAFRVPMEIPAEGIVVNLAGRQSQGTVSPSEYDAVVATIAARLAEIIDPETGEKVVADVLRRDQIYSGPYVEAYAPDLVVVLAPGYKGDWGNSPPVVGPVATAEWTQYRGAHSMDGIIVLKGAGVRRGARLGGASIVDVAPTLLHALGIAVPMSMDGRVLEEAFEDGLAGVRYSHTTTPAVRCPWMALTEREERDILERLHGIGYVE